MTKQFYENDSMPFEFEGVSYTIKVRAHGTYYYSPATRYEPEDSEFDIDDVEATSRVAGVFSCPHAVRLKTIAEARTRLKTFFFIFILPFMVKNNFIDATH